MWRSFKKSEGTEIKSNMLSNFRAAYAIQNPVSCYLSDFVIDIVKALTIAWVQVGFLL